MKKGYWIQLPDGISGSSGITIETPCV